MCESDEARCAIIANAVGLSNFEGCKINLVRLKSIRKRIAQKSKRSRKAPFRLIDGIGTFG
jgi:hypothetical protein